MFLQHLTNRPSPRPIKDTPTYILIVFIIALCCQIYWSTLRPIQPANIKALPVPPTHNIAQLIGLGDTLAIAKILLLWLQAFDNQPGLSVPLKALDFQRLIHWLTRIQELDERSQYPLLMAARIYGAVSDHATQRQIIGFIHRQFVKDPNRRWPALDHAIYIAQHRLKDNDLALKLARSLSLHVSATDTPPWLQQIELYLLEDMGEIEAAKILIINLIDNGVITDPNELQFLRDRLQRLQKSSK